MEVANTPLHLDWSFLAVVVAAIALVLSQLPPIHLLFKKARIDFEPYSKINITHKVGNPNLQLHLLISNTGGRKVRIKDIRASIERDGEQIVTLPAQNYHQNHNDQSTVLFTSFSLNPGEDWSHIINLFNFFGREDGNKYYKLKAILRADLREKSSEIKEGKMKTQDPVELKPECVQPFHDFFEQHFIWLPGEYKLIAKILTDQSSANISKAFRFTIFESHSEQLIEITEHFKYGGGIWWDPDSIQQGVAIDITEA